MRTLGSEKLQILPEAIKLVINSTRNISPERSSDSGSSTLFCKCKQLGIDMNWIHFTLQSSYTQTVTCFPTNIPHSVHFKKFMNKFEVQSFLSGAEIYCSLQPPLFPGAEVEIKSTYSNRR